MGEDGPDLGSDGGEEGLGEGGVLLDVGGVTRVVP